MLIGALADAVGLSSQTIRFYERKGLLPKPHRGANGYRIYDETTLSRLTFILTAQAAGLTLAEIGSIITLRDEGATPCTHVTHLLETKLAEVRARLRSLTHLETEISELIERSHGLDPAHCRDTEICHILTR